MKNSKDTIAKSLEGDYRPEHLFALRQSLAAYRYYQNLVLEVDQEIKLQLGDFKQRQQQRRQHPHERRPLHIKGADMSRRHLTFVGSCIASSEWI